MHAGQPIDFGLQFAGNLNRGALAIVPIHGAQKHIGLTDRGVARDDINTVKLRVFFANALHSCGVFVGVSQGGAIGRVDDVQNHATVLQRRELALHGGQHRIDGITHPQHEQHHHPALRQHLAQGPFVTVGDANQNAFHAPVEPAWFGVVLEKLRAHHG